MDKTPTLFGLQGVKRRLIYVTLYELIAIGAATMGLALLTGHGAGPIFAERLFGTSWVPGAANGPTLNSRFTTPTGSPIV